MVMEEMPKPRDCFVLIRGQYDKPGDKVTRRACPAALPPLPAGQPMNRLGLARWLVDPAHPLTARVQVNRYWELLFGVGLCKSSENFGMQSQYPSHPELLDWLATEYIRLGWDTKAILKTIVMSATYRQSSNVTPELIERDPENRLLARGPRFRMQAELVRDNALAISGLLVDKLGGQVGAALSAGRHLGRDERLRQPAELQARHGRRACIAAACTRSGSAPAPRRIC